MNEWNEARIKEAQAQINFAMVDILTVGMRGKCNENMKHRIAQNLREAADMIDLINAEN